MTAMNELLPIVSTVAAASAGVVAYGAVDSRAQLFGKTLCWTNSPRKLAITFDDGPNPSLTPQLFDLLERYNAKATFFVIGKFARECPDLVRETAARGHLIANHTQTHPNLFWLGPAAIKNELKECADAIGEVLGGPLEWFRPPYGFRNPWVVSTATKLSMRTVMWTLLPGDWRPRPIETLIRNIQPIATQAEQNRAQSKGTGDVLCLHDGGHRGLHADRTNTLKALEYWLPRWRDLGLEFVTIAEAVDAPAS